MRHGRLIAYTLSITLIASVIAGALGVSLHFAKADFSETMYSDDLRDMIEEVNSSATVSLFLNYFENSLENGGLWVVQVSSNQQYFIFCRYIIYSRNSYSNAYFYRGSNYAACYSNSGSSTYFVLMDAFNIYSDTVTYNNYNSAVAPYGIDNFDYLMDSNSNGTFGAHRYNTSFPSPDTYNTNTYFSFDVYASQGGSVIYARNLFHGSVPVVFDYFEILVFWLGERQYITVKDQSYVWHMIDYDNEGEELHYFISFFVDENNNGVPLELHWSNCLLVEGGENFIVGLSNVSPNGVYCWDITGNSYQEVYAFHEYDVVYGSEDTYAGEATNVPYSLISETPGENGQPDSYTNSWTIMNEYITNYNSTHVIPENLVDSIFGVNGFKIYPCDVQIPTNCWTGVSVAGYHTFKYHMAGNNNLGLNYDLMDVVIVPQSEVGNYGLVYFYDDSLQTPYVFVDFINYKELLEQFDIIIIVDDVSHCLEENAWWQQIISSVVWDWADYMAVSGSSSVGISYSDDALIDNVEHGFAIVTKRAIQRQQLYVFNDGISKTYQLMSDYIDKRGDWEDSFLTWTSGLFAQWQTLDGRLSDIYSLLYDLNLSNWMDGISSKLDRLITNTEEEIPEHWFPSLWTWVLQFKPSNNDFSVALDVYDDNWNNIPLLPAPSPVPALPTIQGG